MNNSFEQWFLETYRFQVPYLIFCRRVLDGVIGNQYLKELVEEIINDTTALKYNLNEDSQMIMYYLDDDITQVLNEVNRYILIKPSILPLFEEIVKYTEHHWERFL